MTDRLLSGLEMAREAIAAVRQSGVEIHLVSAFLKSDVVSLLEKEIPAGVPVRMLSRWRMSDLASGASDIEVFTSVRRRRWRFFIDFDLHAKALLIDEKRLFLGSSNFTASGLGIFGSGNAELNVALSPSRSEVDRVKGYFDDAYELNFPMYAKMRDDLAQLECCASPQDLSWSSEITECFKPIDNKIWIAECLTVGPSDRNSPAIASGEIDSHVWGGAIASAQAFRRSRIYKWLDRQLATREEDLRFGELAMMLHSSLIDDPRLYRKDVKDMLRVLIEWVQYFKIFETKKFNVTTVIVNPYAKN